MDYLAPPDRATYEATQLQKATKFAYCKTSSRDARTYLAVLRHDREERRLDARSIGPVACLGVRSGREVDLFRIALRGSPFRRAAVRLLERRWRGFNSWVPLVERFGRDDYRHLHAAACLGVELSPLVRRSDVWVGSFDACPDDWSEQFGVVFSNSFDHAFDPETTATAWWRLLRSEGYLVLDFPQQQAADQTSPVGHLTLADMLQMFPGELVFFRYRGSAMGYSTFVIRKG